jgi:hypothetical protein
VNGGFGFLNRPHPSHPFTAPHPMVYETSQATLKKLMMDKILADEKSMSAR